MGYIWIAMGMGWGVSRGRDDALVMLKRSENKTKAREVERDHIIRSDEISWI